MASATPFLEKRGKIAAREERDFMALLEVKEISIQFGGLKAVSNFNLDLEKGELVAIIGPNGAGKTTVFNMLTGIYRPTSGDILLEGKSLIGKQPHDFNQHGIARTFQNIRLFGSMTVLENLKVSLIPRYPYSLKNAIFRDKAYMAKEEELHEQAMETLEILGLADRAHDISSALPYGAQRRLEIARAMTAKPKILLLDEPVAGMNHAEMDDIIKLIAEIRQRFGLTILLIEHHMRVVMQIADRIKVLDFGETIAEGKPEEIKQNPKVIAAYLGGGAADA